jgi:hypothetical protein
MSSERVAVNVENVTRVSVRRFAFFMKGIAENDLWDEVQLHLEDLGCTEVVVSSEPIAALQELVARQLAEGEQLSPRAKRVAQCGCGVSMPGPGGGGPQFPKPGGPPDGGGGDGGGRPLPQVS